MAVKQTAGRDSDARSFLCRMAEGVGGIPHGKGSLGGGCGGRGYYQEWGKEAVEMTPGTDVSNEWLEPVSDEDYGKLIGNCETSSQS